MRVILASGSPRRRELLSALVDSFEVIPSGVDEPLNASPVQNAIHLALDKARDVSSRNTDALVIGADTIVFLDGQSYEKPKDPADALRIWHELRGRTHGVVTGVAVVSPGGEQTAALVSQVTLRDLSDAAIREYIESGRPMDKAGAYAIQDEDVPTVTRLEGCYCNVMGLPLWTLRGLLDAADIRTREPDSTFTRCAACPDRKSGR